MYENLLQDLERLYKPVRESTRGEITRQADIAKTRALENFAKQGLYQSGAAASQIANTIEEQKQRALGSLESSIAQNEAAGLQNLYQMAMQQAFQKEMAQKAREQEIGDYLRDTFMNLVGGVATPVLTALGKQIGYKLAPDYYKAVLENLKNKSHYSGRGTRGQYDYDNEEEEW